MWTQENNSCDSNRVVIDAASILHMLLLRFRHEGV